ncbi:MAG TPA: hypothetical protein VIL23_03790 [Clostridia bacterium]
MKVQFDFLTLYYGYLAKLIETQLTSLELNQAAVKILEGDYSDYDKVLALSFKMNKNIWEIMNSRKVISTFNNHYKGYAN